MSKTVDPSLPMFDEILTPVVNASKMDCRFRHEMLTKTRRVSKYSKCKKTGGRVRSAHTCPRCILIEK